MLDRGSYTVNGSEIWSLASSVISFGQTYPYRTRHLLKLRPRASSQADEMLVSRAQCYRERIDRIVPRGAAN
jgi:hypothetical protein